MKRNVLLIVVDCARAEKTTIDLPLASAGTRRSAPLPTWDRLRSLGACWSNLHSVSSTTTPNFASMFTGLLPAHHGIREHSRHTLLGNTETLAERLAAAGYHTAAQVTGPLVGETGLGRGFAEYRYRPRSEYLHLGLAEQAAQWLAGLPQPYFALLHLWEAHLPYQNPPGFDGPDQGLTGYDRALALVDHHLGLLTAGVDFERTALVLCGDHGERLMEDYYLDRQLGGTQHPLLELREAFEANSRGPLDYDAWFGEVQARHGNALARIFAHNVLGHGFHLTEDLVRIPLVLVAPDRVRAGETRDELRSQLDLYATLLDLTDVAPRADHPRPGRSLLDPAGDDCIYLEANGSGGKQFESRCYLRGAKTGRWKYWRVEAPQTHHEVLWDLAVDPRETRNVAAAEPQLCRDLGAWIDRQLAGPAAPRTDDPIAGRLVEQRLRELGYVA